MRIPALLLTLTLSAKADPKVDFARGVLEEMRGVNGNPWFEKALAADPDAWPLVSRVADAKYNGGSLEAASTLYRDFALAHPERLEAQLKYATFLRDSSPGDDFAAKLAGEALERALQHHPGNLTAIRTLFRSYEQRGMRQKSLDLFEQTVERAGSGPALAAAEMARTLFPGSDEAARAKVDDVFELAMKQSPGDPVLARQASEHFRTSGRMSKAVEMLEAHVKAAPASLKLRVRLGVLYFASERGEDGEKTLKEVLKIDPRQALAHKSLAKYYRGEERMDEARPHAIELLKLRGGDADEFVELAQELLDDDRPRDARLLLEKGLFDHADDAHIAVKLAIATRRDPSTRQDAAWRFREAESLSGEDGPATEAAFQKEFAEHLLEQGELEPAADRVRTAIKAYSEDQVVEVAQAYRVLAGIFEKQGRSEAQIKPLLRRADALDPPE